MQSTETQEGETTLTNKATLEVDYTTHYRDKENGWFKPALFGKSSKIKIPRK